MAIDICDFNNGYKQPIAIALGFFDCIHIGHSRLINAVNSYRNQHFGVKSALLTFTNDPNLVFGKKKEIYTFDDRVDVLESMSIDVVVGATFDADFINTSYDDFLNKLGADFDIRFIAVGADYTFGKGAEGDVAKLGEFCIKNAIKLCVVPFEELDGEKLSTTYLKYLVQEGKVDSLCELLSSPYFIKGTVLHAKHNGTAMGFPTANISIDRNRLPLCEGIYATLCYIDGKKYQSMTNVGAKPTFGDDSVSIEAYIFDFNQDLYGKEIKIEFIERTRDVIKFQDKNALVEQLKKDEMQIRNILQDWREL